MEKLREFLYRSGAVAEGVLHSGRHLGERRPAPLGNEDRIVAKTLRAAIFIYNAPFDRAFEQMLHASGDEGDNGAEPRRTILRALQIAQKQAVVGVEVMRARDSTRLRRVLGISRRTLLHPLASYGSSRHVRR